MKKINSTTIIGSWRTEKALQAKDWAEQIGQLIAKKKLNLISGAGTGISKLVVESYRKHQGKKYIAYLAGHKYMKKISEEIGPKPDKIINTHKDYLGRNLIMAKKTELAIVLTGNIGALEEILFNIKDYHHPVIVINNYPIANIVKSIPGLTEKVAIIDNIDDLNKILSKYL